MTTPFTTENKTGSFAKIAGFVLLATTFHSLPALAQDCQTQLKACDAQIVRLQAQLAGAAKSNQLCDNVVKCYQAVYNKAQQQCKGPSAGACYESAFNDMKKCSLNPKS
jgi:hypothetical protein